MKVKRTREFRLENLTPELFARCRRTRNGRVEYVLNTWPYSITIRKITDGRHSFGISCGSDIDSYGGYANGRRSFQKAVSSLKTLLANKGCYKLRLYE